MSKRLTVSRLRRTKVWSSASNTILPLAVLIEGADSVLEQATFKLAPNATSAFSMATRCAVPALSSRVHSCKAWNGTHCAAAACTEAAPSAANSAAQLVLAALVPTQLSAPSSRERRSRMMTIRFGACVAGDVGQSKTCCQQDCVSAHERPKRVHDTWRGCARAATLAAKPCGTRVAAGARAFYALPTSRDSRPKSANGTHPFLLLHITKNLWEGFMSAGA